MDRTASYGRAGGAQSSPRIALPQIPYRRKRRPARWRIAYAIVDAPDGSLGRLLVGATKRVVCAVSMGASDADLARALEREYPAATITADGGPLGAWTRAIVAHQAGRKPRLDLPIDVQATAFQWQVWKALSAIPYGETRTYGQVAKAIGRPRAVRAVARACATNPVAIAIPCHRVLPAAGGTGGYRWGARRKQALLDRERGPQA